MKAEDLRVGDLVIVEDGSWSINMDYKQSDRISNRSTAYRVVKKLIDGSYNGRLKGIKVHDIIIANTVTGETYLHSASMVERAVPEVKEVSMADVESKFGCKVKIVKKDNFGESPFSSFLNKELYMATGYRVDELLI